MSTDYDVWCLDCGNAHGFYDANHAKDLMLSLVEQKHLLFAASAALETLRERMTESQVYCSDLRLELQHQRYPVDFSWWREHGRHRLAVRDEYGRFSDTCGEWYKCPTCKEKDWTYEQRKLCPECGGQHKCHRPKDHDGDHSPRRDDGGKI